MPDYSNGKIYTIRNRNDDTKIYVGSTIQPLYKRFYKHKSKSKQCMNYLLYKEVNNDWTNWYIELYENYPCNSKEELLKREGEVIRLIGTLNMIIAGRDKKEYRIENIDKIKEMNQHYYIENMDKIKELHKQYKVANADKIKEYKKQYQKENAEKINEYNRLYRLKKKEEKSQQDN